MATVRRLKYTRYVVPDPNDAKKTVYVSAKTPGAKKITENGGTYFVVYKQDGKTRRVATGLTDKGAAQQYLATWNQARERGETGVTDPFRVHLDRPVTGHVNDYLQTLSGRSDQYQKEVRRVLGKVAGLKGVVRLRDVTTEVVTRYLDGMTAGVVTRRLHRSYLSGLFAFLRRLKRVPHNSIDDVPVPKESAKDRVTTPRVRRAYTVAELRKLLTAARDYPLATRGKSQGRRSRADGTPAAPRQAAKLAPQTAAALATKGRERELVYRLLFATGLRRGELSRVTVGMFDGAKLTVPKSILKHRPRHLHAYVIPLPATLAGNLAAFGLLAKRTPTDPLVYVPTRRNFIREHLKRLKHAGIEYQTGKGFADIHAFRSTVNQVLKRRGVPLDQRQACLRHTPRDMTTARYDPDAKQATTMTVTVRKILSRLDRVITTPAPAPK